jgi:hypothetical protein
LPEIGPAFLEGSGFPLQCTYVELAWEDDPETGFYRTRIVDRCANLPKQRVNGIYCCDDHAEQAQGDRVTRARTTEEGVMFPS